MRCLTAEEEKDARSYLSAHRWSGAQKFIARKYGVSAPTVSRLCKRIRIEQDVARRKK